MSNVKGHHLTRHADMKWHAVTKNTISHALNKKSYWYSYIFFGAVIQTVSSRVSWLDFLHLYTSAHNSGINLRRCRNRLVPSTSVNTVVPLARLI